MNVIQIKDLINSVTSEVLGETAILNEDLSNVVDVGASVFNQNAVDAYARTLVNQIGKMIFVNRKYLGGAPSVLMDGWEYGSVCEKVTVDMPTAEENESWELTSGSSYDPNIFTAPTVSAKFFNKRVTFEIQMSITEKQIKQSFTSAEQLNSFLSTIYTAIENSMTVKLDALVMRTINNLTGETLYSDMDDGVFIGASGVKAINLLCLYNENVNDTGTDLTFAEAMVTPEFFRYASYIIGLTKGRMSKISSLFNIGGKERFTPDEDLHLVFLADFVSGLKAYLQSSAFNDEYIALPNGIEDVPYWQGSGTGYTLADTSSINIKTTGNHTVNTSGILGVMFDRNALGVSNIDRRVTTQYNAKGEFWNNFYKFDAGYFNDENENFVVFYAA